MRRLTKNLLSKSQEAFILALELYNKPTIEYRIQAFAFLYCNAWELLLKAKLVNDEGAISSIYYKKKRNQPRRTLSLRDCIKKVFPNERDAIRKNIEDIIEIRDAAVHFIVPELEEVYQGMFQAGVLNFVSNLEGWFSTNISDKCTPAMLSLLSQTRAIEPVKLRKKYGKEILDFVIGEQHRLDTAENELNNTKYRIPVEYRLVLTKSAKDADISLTSGPGSEIGLIIEVPKDLDRTHPFLTNEAITEIGKRLKGVSPFNSYDFQAVVLKEKVKGKPQFHYLIKKPECNRYSKRFIDLVVEKIKQDPSYRERARDSYRRHLQAIREANLAPEGDYEPDRDIGNKIFSQHR